jgi:hypothetical protein
LSRIGEELPFNVIAARVPPTASKLPEIMGLRRLLKLSEVQPLATALGVRACWLAFNEGPMHAGQTAEDRTSLDAIQNCRSRLFQELSQHRRQCNRRRDPQRYPTQLAAAVGLVRHLI